MYQSVFNIKETPCKIQCETCSDVARFASNTRPTPIALRRLDVVYTGVFRVFCYFEVDNLLYMVINLRN